MAAAANPIHVGALPALDESKNPLDIIRNVAQDVDADFLVHLLDLPEMTAAELGRILLAERGLGKTGKWIGFKAARTLHNVEIANREVQS